MNLEAYLLKYRTPAELAAELAALARAHAKLKDRVGQLEHEIFWLRAVEDQRIEQLKVEHDAHVDFLLSDHHLNGP